MGLQAFAITFSDGLVTFLIIAATLAFLRKTRQPTLAAAVVWGIAVSIVTSVIGAWLFSRADNQALWEMRFAVAVAAAVVGLAVYMWGARARLTNPAARTAAATTSRTAALAFFLFTALVVSLEGLHTLLLIGTFVFQIRVPALTIGVISGLVFAGLIAWWWARYGHRLSLKVFVPITVIILAVVMTQLVTDAIQNLTNASTPPPVTQPDFGPER